MFFRKYDSKTDNELMVLVQGKDHRAFSELYNRYASRLNAFFFRMLWSDSEMARDYVQELFAKLIQKPELYNAQYDFEPWVFRIASNMCKNAYRKAAFEQAHREQQQHNGQAHDKLDIGSLDAVAMTNQIHLMLDKMDEDRRTIFLLRYQQDLSIKEIAEMMSLSEGTVKSKLFYTREKIKKSLIE